VQETALRAVRDRVPFSSADDLLRWASTVGLRLATDVKRRRRFIDPAPVPERECPHDVGATVERRLTLAAVADALTRLSDADRSAILAPSAEGAVRTRRESVKQSVARHRARGRLRALVEGLVVLVGWLVRRCRASLPTRAVLAAALILPGVWFIAGGGHPPSHPAPAQGRAPWVVESGRASGAVPLRTPPAPRGGVVTPRPARGSPAPGSAPVAGRGVRASIAHTTPTGHTVRVFTRPAEAGDHVLCVKARVIRQCVDLPPALPPR
jgi:hypothetical protein